jgi:uncharacterized protein
MSAELGPAVIAFVALACLVAGFAHGALGFGFPIVATPMVALAIDIKSAIALLAPVTLVLTVISALRGVALASIVREFWFLPLATALGAWLGTRILLARIDAATYRRWLRGALWVMALALLVQFSTRVAASEEALWRAIEQDDETAALTLVRSGNLDVKARNAAGDTPLHRAAEKGMRSLAESLLARGAEVNARAKNGETPLHFAALDADASVAELLLDAGADASARNEDGESVLMWAALSGHIAVAQRLLARGADANAKDRKGSLPLHAAADGGHLELARLLLSRTQEPQAKNAAGKSALDYARANGYAQLEKLLERPD